MKTKNFDMEISSPKHVQKHQLQLLCSRMDVFLRIQRPIKFTSNCFPQKNHVPHCFLSSETLPQSCVRYHILPFSWGKNTSMFATFKKHGKLFFQQLTTKALCLQHSAIVQVENFGRFIIPFQNHLGSFKNSSTVWLSQSWLELFLDWLQLVVFVGKPLYINANSSRNPGSKGSYQCFSN